MPETFEEENNAEIPSTQRPSFNVQETVQPIVEGPKQEDAVSEQMPDEPKEKLPQPVVIQTPQNIVPQLPEIELSVKERFDLSQKPLREAIVKYLPEMEEYYISPDNYSFIYGMTIERFKSTSKEELPEWKLKDMSKILGKILIPDSVKPTLDNAKVVAKHMETMSDKNLQILELCTGAGISGMMTWNEIKKSCPEKTCSIVTVDNSLASLIMSEVLLRMKGVPVRWSTLEGLEKDSDFDGVSLVELDASSAVKYYLSKGAQFNGIVSDHGINYFNPTQHDQIVNAVPSLLKDGGIFQICALENSPKVSLNNLKMALNIFSFGKDLLKTLPNENEPYDIEMINGLPYVRGINSKESAGLYMLLRENLRKFDFRSFGKYLGSIIGVAKATKELSGDVNSPVANTEALLKGCTVVPSFAKQNLSIARSLFYIK